MTISKCLVKIVNGGDLTEEESYQSMMDIMKGWSTHAVCFIPNCIIHKGRNNN